jgi:glycosyltransferase involved in cell wall biosynthesis
VPGLTLEIAGEGSEGARLRGAASDGVTFLGQVADVRELYERNAIVVAPSRGEGFGMVALEAAERGRAAIVADVGGLPEIVEAGVTGLVVPPEDDAALAAAIVALASDHEGARQFGEAARARALSQFSAGAAADGVEAVYRRLLASHAPTGDRRSHR